jgi:hypothetical protein
MQDLMGAMMSPYATPSQQQYAKEQLAILQAPPTPQMQTYKDDAGSVWQKDPSTGKLTIVQDNSKAEKSKWGIIGEDQYGNKQYGFVDPSTGKVTPYAAQQGQPGQPDATTTDPNLHGADYMATLPPPMQTQVQAIIEGRAAYPTGTLLKSPQWQRIAEAVTRVDPTFEAGNATARVKARVEFETGAQNSPGSQIQAGNTAIDHLALLTGAADKLPSTSGSEFGPIGSYVTGKAGEMTTAGQAATAKYNAEVGNFAKEMVRYLTGGEGTVADRQGIMNSLSATLTPEARKAVINGYVDQMNEKKGELQARWHNAMGPMVPDFATLSPQAQRSLGTISQWSDPTGAAAPTGGQPAAAGPSPASSGVAGPGVAAGAPQVGFQKGGYTFKGGNPADPASWGKN